MKMGPRTNPVPDHDCRRGVIVHYRNDEVRTTVYNSLRRSGLTSDQTLDAINALEDANIVFGELHLNGNTE